MTPLELKTTAEEIFQCDQPISKIMGLLTDISMLQNDNEKLVTGNIDHLKSKNIEIQKWAEQSRANSQALNQLRIDYSSLERSAGFYEKVFNELLNKLILHIRGDHGKPDCNTRSAEFSEPPPATWDRTSVFGE